jgi:hypothetical protein
VVSILDRDIDIESLVVIEPRVRIVIYEDGSNNLPKPAVARGGKKPVERFVALAIRRFRVENGLVEINEWRVSLDVRGENLTARLSYERAGPLTAEGVRPAVAPEAQFRHHSAHGRGFFRFSRRQPAVHRGGRFATEDRQGERRPRWRTWSLRASTLRSMRVSRCENC